MVRKKKLQEYEERIKQATVVLGMVAEDTTTPRNIRRAAKKSIEALELTQYTPAVKGFKCYIDFRRDFAGSQYATLYAG